VLLKLAVLSEVASTAIRATDEARPTSPRVSREQKQPRPLVASKTARESAPPKGVNQDAIIDGKERAPSKHLSLHAHYLWRMQRAQRDGDTPGLLMLAAMAMRDYIDLVEPRNARHDATEGQAVRRLLSEWEGCPSSDVATWMAVPGQSRKSAQAWVRKQRILNGRDPEDGTPSEQDETLSRVVVMKKAGVAEKIIANEMGKSKTQIRNLLAGV
jgi:hypothetical protein